MPPDNIRVGEWESPHPASQAAQLDGTRFLVLAGLVGLTHGPLRLGPDASGQQVDAFLDRQFELNLGRGIYPHLNQLVEYGFAEKQPGTGTRNIYAPTQEGIDVVRAATNWLQLIVGEDGQGDGH